MSGIVELPIPGRRLVGRYPVSISVPQTKNYEIEDQAEMRTLQVEDITVDDEKVSWIGGIPASLVPDTKSVSLHAVVGDRPVEIRRFLRWYPADN